MKSKIFVFVLVAAVSILMMSGTAFAEEDFIHFSGGNGSMGNPYQIGTPDQLQNMDLNKEFLKSHFILINDIDFEDWGGTWVPIGNETDSLSFNGTFDSKGFTISNLTIESEEDNSGLFGYTNNASFLNLNLKT